ncbi:MAG: hypothetical protein ACREMK_03875 [Gemmatimonadota bacterium]
MQRFIVPALIMILATACQPGEETPSEEEGAVEGTAGDTMAADTMAYAPADSVSQWIPAGQTTAVRTPNGKACLYVTSEAADATQFGDSIRITIARVLSRPDVLPVEQDLPPAFRGAAAAGHKVFPPVYQFNAYDATGQLFTEFSEEGESVIVVAMCVTGRTEKAESFDRALLARPDPANPDSLQLFEWEEPPAECRLTCEPRGGGPPEQQATSPLGQWLAGSPISATPAYAAQCTTCFWRGIGGGGAGNSPFAAVDTVTADNASPAQQRGRAR